MTASPRRYRLLAFIFDYFIGQGFFGVFSIIRGRELYWWEWIGLSLVLMVFGMIFLIRYKTTPGKYLLKLKILDFPTNSQTSLFKLFLREGLIKPISLIFGGFILILFTENKRALHDYIMGTWIIREDQPPGDKWEN